MSFVASCNKENDPNSYKGENYAYLSLDNGSQRNEVAAKSQEEIKIILRLTKAVEQDELFKLEISGDLKKFFGLDKAEISITKGNFEGSLILKPQIPRNFYEEGVKIAISLKALPKGILLSDKKEVELLLLPNIKKQLSEREEKLVTAYEKKYGIDLRPFLGQMECNGTIDWAGMGEYDYPNIIAPEKLTVSKQVMIVKLSEKATEDKIVLKFEKNALGLNHFFSKIWNNYTILDEQFWNYPDPAYTPPSNKAIREKINWTKENYANESFETDLDNIRLDPKSGKIDFLGKRGSAVKENQKDYPYSDERKERIKVVPFFYRLSVFERMIQAVKEDPEFAQIIETSDTNIYSILSDSKIDEDGLIEDGAFGETKYVKPTASIDFKAGKMSFLFPQHIYNSDAYSIFNIECSIIE